LPEHHHRGGHGLSWGLIAILAAITILGPWSAFALDMNDVRVIAFTIVVAAVVGGLGAVALVLHYQRAVGRTAPQRRIYVPSRRVDRVLPQRRRPRELPRYAGQNVVAKMLPSVKRCRRIPLGSC
jgi:hypothetical protein